MVENSNCGWDGSSGRYHHPAHEVYVNPVVSLVMLGSQLTGFVAIDSESSLHIR